MAMLFFLVVASTLKMGPAKCAVFRYYAGGGSCSGVATINYVKQNVPAVAGSPCTQISAGVYLKNQYCAANGNYHHSQYTDGACTQLIAQNPITLPPSWQNCMDIGSSNRMLFGCFDDTSAECSSGNAPAPGPIPGPGPGPTPPANPNSTPLTPTPTPTTNSGNVPFKVPFSVDSYEGSLEAVGGNGKSGAVVYWRLAEDEISLGLAGTGMWVGFGMNDKTPSMVLADIVICREHVAGAVSAADYYAPRLGAPQLDVHQDWVTVQAGREVNPPLLPVTWCEIKRSRWTCDPTEDYQIAQLSAVITGLLAWAPAAQLDDALRGHQSNRRQQLFSFCGDVAPKTGLPSDVQMVGIEVPSHTVSSAAGTLVYSYHKFDIDANKKYHAIQWYQDWNKQSTSGLAGTHHHMGIGGCVGPVPGAVLGAAISEALVMEHCQDIYLPGSAATLHNDEGIPIGAIGGGEQRVYFVIQRHFYNPTGKVGLTDHGSKFQVVYTEQLRPKEVSTVHILNMGIKVPPKTFGYVHRAHCIPGCMAQMGAVQASSVQFHAHGHARAAWLRHIRRGVELEPIAHVEPYDDSLASRRLNVVILPEDELILDCVYDNDFDTPITFGEAIDQEMCSVTMTTVGNNPIRNCVDFPNFKDAVLPYSPNIETDCARCLQANFPCPVADLCRLVNGDPFGLCIKQHVPNFQFQKLLSSSSSSMLQDLGYVSDVPGRRGNPNAGNDKVALKYQPYIPAMHRCDTQQEKVSAIPGACSAQVISGAKDCTFKWGSPLRVSWETDCTRQKVTFTLERDGVSGWLGIGLHDAGTANLVTALTPTVMNGADIVQVSPSTGAFKDGYGTGYTSPPAKTATTATLKATKVQNGRMSATFTRPFAASQGTSLQADRFVWLICACRSSDDLDAKHEEATALSKSRISLFGGVAESSRSVAKSKKPTATASSTLAGNMSLCEREMQEKSSLLATYANYSYNETSDSSSSIPVIWLLSSFIMMSIALSEAMA